MQGKTRPNAGPAPLTSGHFGAVKNPTADILAYAEIEEKHAGQCYDDSGNRQANQISHGNNRRPSIDPVVLVKYLLIGFLYGIESERGIEQEIQVNMGLSLVARSGHRRTASRPFHHFV